MNKFFMCGFVAFELCVVLAIIWIAQGSLGWLDVLLGCVCYALAVCIDAGKLKLIWQSPKIVWHAGLYLKVGNKRYRLVRAGPR